MKIRFSPSLQKELKNIKRTNPNLSQKILKQLKLFKINPNYPSLRNHKLTGFLFNTRSIYIDMSIRATYKLLPDGTAYFFDLGTHDEVYKK